MPKLRDLQPGTRFRYPESGKSAVLVRLGDMGASIKFDGSSQRKSFTVQATGDEVEFVAPGAVIIVSDYSDVEVL